MPGALARRLVAHDQVVGEAVAARHALDRHRQPGHVGLHQIDHAVDGGGALGRAFGLDPALDAADHGADVDGSVLHDRHRTMFGARVDRGGARFVEILRNVHGPRAARSFSFVARIDSRATRHSSSPQARRS